MDSLQAGVLNIKLPHILKWTDDRIRVANRYFNGLKGLDYIELPKVRPNSKHSFHVFGIKLKNRDDLKAYLEKNGISCQIHYPKAMPFMPAYKYLGALQSDYPNAYSLQNQELSLPIYPEMKDNQIDYIVEKIKNFTKI
jgi:dTDP-4-amino-4,6-dideoxygalactose transaminase